MRQMTFSPQIQQMLAIGVPVAALLISLAVVYPTWGHYRVLSREVSRQKASLARLRAAPLPPQNPTLPAVRNAPGESARFLGQIVVLSRASRCRFVGMDSSPAAPSRAGEVLRAIRTRVEVEGQYPQVRQFLAQLAAAPRLFVVTSLELNTRIAGRQTAARARQIHAVAEIERYLANPQGTGAVSAR